MPEQPEILAGPIETVPVDEITPHPENPRRGSVSTIVESILEHGQYRPIVVQRETGWILAGNHTYLAAREAGMTEVAVSYVDVDEAEARRILLVDNRTSDLGTYDTAVLTELLEVVQVDYGDLAGTGYDDAALEDLVAINDGPPDGSTPDAPNLAGLGERPSLSDRFVIPPFSVLDGRSGRWTERKARWLATGIRSEIGRTDSLMLPTPEVRVSDYYRQKLAAEEKIGRELSRDEFIRDHLRYSEQPGISTVGTSVFDPVLAELAYRWFTAEDDLILDPFAGGSVRGIMAAYLRRRYLGIDLSAEQVDANREQARDLLDAEQPTPQWIEGDSATVVPELDASTRADFVFSCPPYFDLEEYSDDERDLSAMGWEEFLRAYRAIVAASIDRLADDRFACFVVGEVRGNDARGAYRNLVGETVRAFEDAGARYYNEAILVTMPGSIAIRTGRPFERGRKIAKTHQNVLVFVKGDAYVATERLGTIDVDLGLDDLKGEIEGSGVR
jgi:DNA modification methylase